MNITQLLFRWLPDFLYFGELNLTKQQWFFYKWVKRHLKWAYMPIECESVNPQHEIIENQSIFMYWKQGWENAPELVKRCLASIKANAGGHPLILLDETNLAQYVKMPAFIEKSMLMVLSLRLIIQTCCVLVFYFNMVDIGLMQLVS